MAFSTIDKSTLHQEGKTYLGSASAVTTTGLGFQPDLVWVKDRDNGNTNCLVDAVRGVGKYLVSNTVAAEVDNSTNSISAFTSDGFTTGTGNPANESASTTLGFMSWNWKANGAGSLNEVGSTASTVSANTTSGFSIVKYTGTGANATVGHGLGVVPKFIIVKVYSTTNNWRCYHEALGNDYMITLELTDAKASSSTAWNSTTPTSTVFSLGSLGSTNSNTETFIAYCFADISGFSKFSNYIGNGSSTGDGSFIYTGFKPTFVMVKRTNGAKNWHIFDTTRSTYNITKADLKPNTAGVEDDSNDWLDILSNGFKWRIASGDADYADVNGDGDTYIYMAFGQPIISNSGTCATAR